MATRKLEVEIVGDADKARKAYKDAEDQADSFEKKSRDTFDKSGTSADGFGSKLDGLGSKASDLGKGLALGLGVGAGALAAGLFVQGFQGAMEKEASQSQLQIQLGLPPEMAKAAGDVAGQVYAEAFGDSIGEANQAIRYIAQNMGGLGDITKDELKDMTEGVLTLADAFGEDLNKVTATAGTLIKTGLAKDGKQALDILTKGLQSPANKAEDLLDTFTEYSTQFRELGLTAPQALGLMSQALQAGARDSDTVADSLKEFAIRAQDGSATTATAFAAIGLNATTMAQQIAGGGEPAAAALQLTFEKLAAIEDPALRAQVATGLFGTKAEDLQNALAAMDVTTATDQIGQVEGSMNNATAATDTNAARVEAWRRGLETNISEFIAVSVIPALDSLSAKSGEMSSDWDNYTGLVGRFHDGLNDFGRGCVWLKNEVLDPMIGTFQTLFGWIGDTIEKLENLKDNSFIQFLGDAGLGTMSAPGAIVSWLIDSVGGFDTGGTVPGPVGASRLAVVHGGETILPTHRLSPAAAAGAVGMGMSTVAAAPVYVQVVPVDGRYIVREVTDFQRAGGKTPWLQVAR